MAFVEPLLDGSAENLEPALKMGQLAWNLGNLGEVDREEVHRNVGALHPPEMAGMYLRVLDEMIERKQEVFPEYQEIIAECNVKKEGKGFAIELRVMSKDDGNADGDEGGS